MELNPDQLEALSAVVEFGTFEAAARALTVTPSAVSQRIKALESSVGRVLVNRTKPAVLTESGEVLLRAARQVDLVRHDALAALGTPDAATTISLAINADSLATWALAPLADVAALLDVRFDIHREDQAHSTRLLRQGVVMAAITSDPRPVQGCTVSTLGSMTYRLMASPAFTERWFARGLTTAALRHAPVVVFDRKDDLQAHYLRARSRTRLDPPRHYIPSSGEFAAAVRLGLGWGMLPEAQFTQDVAAGTLLDLDPDRGIDVPLYWQQWRLESRILNEVAAAVSGAAPRH